MDNRPKRELIDGIRDFLKDFEEPYDHREWEHFRRQRKSKHRKPVSLFVKLAGIAASLFLMVYASVRFLPFFDEVNEADKNAPKEAPHPFREKGQQNMDTLAVDSITPSPYDTNRKYERAPKGPLSPARLPDITPEEETEMPKLIVPINKAGLMSDSARIERIIKKIPLHRKTDKSMRVNFPHLWPLTDNRIGFRDTRIRFNDTRIGFGVNPAFTEKGFSIGGGVSAQIPLSRRISAEIGVNYSNLKVGTDMKPDKPDTVSIQTIGIRNAVGMVAIPVFLNYAVTENFSASLGVVPFKVVRDQRTDILQSYRWIGSNGLSGDTTGRLVGERTKSQRADSLYMGNTYLGFIQISGQFSPPFLKKYNAVIAPFVAIPVGKLRNDEYRWLHGGVSFRIYLR